MRPLLCWARVEAEGLEVEVGGAGLGDSLPWEFGGGGRVRGVMDDVVSPQLPDAATHTRPSPWETGVTHWTPMLRRRWCIGSCSWGGTSSGGCPPIPLHPQDQRGQVLTEASPPHLDILSMCIS